MTEHKGAVGYATVLAGFCLVIMGASVIVEWLNEGHEWFYGIKGPVWVLIGAVFTVVGREFVDDAKKGR
jgi:hypothetical protein